MIHESITWRKSVLHDSWLMACKYDHNLSFLLRKKSIKNTDVYSPAWSVSLNNGKNCFLRKPQLLLWHYSFHPIKGCSQISIHTSAQIYQNFPKRKFQGPRNSISILNWIREIISAKEGCNKGKNGPLEMVGGRYYAIAIVCVSVCLCVSVWQGALHYKKFFMKFEEGHESAKHWTEILLYI